MVTQNNPTTFAIDLQSRTDKKVDLALRIFTKDILSCPNHRSYAAMASDLNFT